jgi:hypothetical protein
VAVDFFQCSCGADVWRSQDDLVREYGEGAYHYCPLDDEPQGFYERNRGGDVYRRVSGGEAPATAPVDDASPAPGGDGLLELSS